MKTSELIPLLETTDVTDKQLYNLLIEDLDSATRLAAGSLDDPMPQALIRFFMYQIQAVIFPVIRNLRHRHSQDAA